MESLRPLAELPEGRPTHGPLLADAAGNLWISQFPDLEEEPTQWDVFGPDGVWLSEVLAPTHLRILAVGTDRLLGVREDESGWAEVRIHRLHKP